MLRRRNRLLPNNRLIAPSEGLLQTPNSADLSPATAGGGQGVECNLRTSAIRALLPLDIPNAADADLRDAVAVLADNIATGQQEVERRPELAPTITSATEILAFWRVAIGALDAGDQAAADSALANATAEMNRAEAANPQISSC